MLVYDLPETSKFPNPSPILRRRAVRVNLSVWIIPEEQIPYNLLDRMKRAGATWRIVPYADEAVEDLLEYAREEIIRQAVKREEETRRKLGEYAAAARRAAAEGDPDAEKDFRRRCQDAMRRSRTLFRDLKEVSIVFGVGCPSNLSGAMSRMEMFDAAFNARMRATLRATREAERIGRLTGDGRMGAAAYLDAVPPGILSDYLEENGADAQELRDVFLRENGRGPDED